MAIAAQINEDIKTAMKAKDRDKLDALRAIKSALLLAATEKGGSGEVEDDLAIKAMQKLVKQRKESARIFQEQGREDLAKPELDQSAVIEHYLPAQMSEGDIRNEVKSMIAELGAEGMKDMGRVMGMLSKKLAGKADGRIISTLVKEELS